MAKFLLTLQVAMAVFVVMVSLGSLIRLYHGDGNVEPQLTSGHGEAISRAELALMIRKLSDLQSKLKIRMSEDKDELFKKDALIYTEVLVTLDLLKSYILRINNEHAPRTNTLASTITQQQSSDSDSDDLLKDDDEDDSDQDSAPLVKFFLIEEIKKYLRIKENKHKRKNFMGANITVGAIGHACVSMKTDLEEYMEYDVGDLCKDDWPLGQRLMVHGCDPLPRRRCLARAPPYYQKPLPMNQSLWGIHDNRNIRWSRYNCRNFQCLQNGTNKGFSKCSACFNLMTHEAPRWVVPTSNVSIEVEFLIKDVLQLKPGEIRIGLDWSVGVGTFAARMREHNVTIVSATLNLGAPFNEFIALRGLIPLYISLSQRLPFFDNTLDIVHTTLLFDGWIDLQFLDFIIFDLDRVLRPGGLLWIDRFFCLKEDLEDYLYMFAQLRYKKHKWVTAPKVDKSHPDEMYFSAILEKPPRPF